MNKSLYCPSPASCWELMDPGRAYSYPGTQGPLLSRDLETSLCYWTQGALSANGPRALSYPGTQAAPSPIEGPSSDHDKPP